MMTARVTKMMAARLCDGLRDVAGGRIRADYLGRRLRVPLLVDLSLFLPLGILRVLSQLGSGAASGAVDLSSCPVDTNIISELWLGVTVA